MSNLRDMNGEAVQAASQETVRLLDHAITGYARARRDTRDRLAAVLASDPTCVDGALPRRLPRHAVEQARCDAARS